MSEDYTSVLSVSPGASHAECRAAYIALAKEWHPDRNSDPEAAARFIRLSVAYAASVRATGARAHGAGDGAVGKVLRCQGCSGRVDVPKRAEFTGIISLLVWSKRWNVAGIFCARCARSVALKTAAVSLFFGWWSVQGVVLAPLSILRSARGGRQDKAINFKLACHNLVALAAAGELDEARTLARLIVAEGHSLPVTVARLVSSLSERRRDPPAGKEGPHN